MGRLRSARAHLTVFALLVAGIMTARVSAHHGTSVSYDDSKNVTLTGKVTEFWWRNPHSALFVDVADDKGEMTNWSVEMGSPATLMRSGWSRGVFKAGDQVSIVVHPSRSGTTAGVCANPCTATVNGTMMQRVQEQ
jgi:hypothetical protein